MFVWPYFVHDNSPVLHACAMLCSSFSQSLLQHVCAAVRLLMPGELAKHAITEGAKAVNKITSEKR